MATISSRISPESSSPVLQQGYFSFEGTHFGRPWCERHGSVGCDSSLDIPLASVGRPPRFKPSSEGLGLSPGAWGVPKRRMPTGPEAFLGLPDASGLWPCDWTHLKKYDLVPYSSAGGTWDKYSSESSCQVDVPLYVQLALQSGLN